MSKPDEDNEKKLTRVMKYLQSSIDMELVLECDNPIKAIWWVDALYAVNYNMKSQTRGAMSLGKGAVYATLNKQKLVTQSLTAAELVGLHNVLPQGIWTQNFLKAQGYFPNKPTTVFQDNISAILLEKNGCQSAGKRSKHIDLQYFFAKDCISSGGISVEHIPTDKMIAYFFTKLLQGALFQKMQA